MRTVLNRLPAALSSWARGLRGTSGLQGGDARPLRFRCNICGWRNRIPRARLTREDPSCRCGSTVRQRAIIHLLTEGLFGKSLALDEIPERPDIAGVDMSGADVYAVPLANRLGYTNTFLHKAPFLDITAPADGWIGTCDFVISSDVFEHVAPPVSVAFINARRLLKPGGLFIMTVPWATQGPTLEHFPDLAEYRLEQRDGMRILVNRTADGRTCEHRDLVFHGGDGETLEMRLFSASDLLRQLTDAGFSEIRVRAEPFLSFGIVWQHPWSLPITARRSSE